MVLIDSNSTVLHIGDAMPAFTLPSVNAGEVNSAAILEPVVAVIFTCNHCPYAQAYEDRLIDLCHRLEPRGLRMILICSNDATGYPDDAPAAMEVRARSKQYTAAYAHDESQEVAKAFGALCTPHCFVFGPDRTLKYKGRIDDSWREAKAVTQRNLEDAIVALVEGRDPPIAEANAIGCSIKWKQ